MKLRLELDYSRELYTLAQTQPEQIKQVLRQKIDEALESAKDLAADHCASEIRSRLSAIQSYCQTVEKAFIVVEERITCNQFALGGDAQDSAILFRGPSKDASVAICVTTKGSLLYRSSCAWIIYRNVGDVRPIECLPHL